MMTVQESGAVNPVYDALAPGQMGSGELPFSNKVESRTAVRWYPEV